MVSDKSKIPDIRSGVSYGDRKINLSQAMALWLTDLTLRGKIVDLNNFKTDILSDAIEESQIDFEYTINGKRDLSKPKEFSHEKWTQW